MRYMIPRKFWDLGARFDIFDEDRRPQLSVTEGSFSWDPQWTIEDLDGRKLAYVESDMSLHRVTYRICRDEQPWIEIAGSIFERRVSEVKLTGEPNYVASGDFWQLEYRFTRGDEVLATVGQHRWTHADMISIETADEDDLSILLATMCLEYIRK
ncbi:MAG: hypothetical protein KDB14_20990 [Planctomycetales bacterium]|nr:hypothetical protein [Planctomycetales bacterium]